MAPKVAIVIYTMYGHIAKCTLLIVAAVVVVTEHFDSG